MFILRGSLAHSHFRIERLLTQVNNIVPQVNSIYTEFVHFVDLKSELTKLENKILANLLSYGDYPTEVIPETANGALILIVPKLGTISSWSLKATEITKLCGLHQVQKIERGTVYYLKASEKLTWGDKQAIANLLYDPKYEVAFYQFSDLEDHFSISNHAQDSVVGVGEIEHIEKARFCGFSVLNLQIPRFLQPWEIYLGKPTESSSALEIMLEVPQSCAHVNNELGLPTLCGYFRTYEQCVSDPTTFSKMNFDKITIEEAVFRLLKLPCIADKSFLIHIFDRSVGGLVVRDQMIGPWQVPVSDCAVTVRGIDIYQGEAMAIGERSPIAIINPVAGARMAIGEAITNIAAANIKTLSDIRLTANVGSEIVEAIPLDLCQTLGITMAVNQGDGFVISAVAPVEDVRFILTPLLMVGEGETLLIFIDLSGGHKRLGGSAIAQVFNQFGGDPPNVDDPKLLKSFFTILQQLHTTGKILAYHDRSDGGLFITLCEMAFASHVGLTVDVSELGLHKKTILFNEELGAVIQIRSEDADLVLSELGDGGVFAYVMGTLNHTDEISIIFNGEVVFSSDRILLQQAWSETSFHIQSLRDNPRCAKKQYEAIKDREDQGLSSHLTFDPEEDITTQLLNLGARPRVAILREHGTLGHTEMAAAFDRAQFECVNVQISELKRGMIKLKDFKGLAVCGGASFGDVLGAGQGWAKLILFNADLKEQFEDFFNRGDTFTLGFSNGCQMLSYLKTIIPGAQVWPKFVQNYSEQFESRLCLVEVQNTPSIFLKGMEGSRLLVPVAHREGRVEFANEEIQEGILKQGLAALRYVDHWGRKTKIYPANPSGSPLGITGLTTLDGKVLIMMPHPDRAFRSIQYSWHPKNWGEDAPWLRLFRNARNWVG